jgi:hypothetical protein
MKEIAQCITHHHYCAILRQEEAKKVLPNPNIWCQFQYNKSDDTYTCPQGEILKPRKMAQEKRWWTEQSGYQFKYRTPVQKIVQ